MSAHKKFIDELCAHVKQDEEIQHNQEQEKIKEDNDFIQTLLAEISELFEYNDTEDED